jgi:hypothetical protein
MIEVTIVQGGRKEPALPGGRRSRPQPLELIDAERAGLGRRARSTGPVAVFGATTASIAVMEVPAITACLREY